MPNLTDQEFDNLFRQAASRVSPENSPGDWDDMERRLVAAERDARARNISLYMMVALLLIYSFLMPDTLKTGNYNQASLMPAGEQQSSHPSARVSEAGTAKTSTTKGKELREVITSEAMASKASRQRQEPPAAGSEGSHNERVDAGSRSAEHARAEALVVPSTNSRTAVSASDQHGVNGKQMKAGSRYRVPDAQGELLATGISQTSGKQIDGDHYRDTRSSSLNGNHREIEFLEVPSTQPLQASVRKPGHISLATGRITGVQAPVRHPWFVKLAISPDFSSIDYGSAGQTGINFGPMVEYGISPRFSVSTGAIWSKKLYDQQNPEKSYGSGGYPVYANSLNGDCRIIDIPLNVTYYMMPGRKTNLFVTVGSSSYVMLQEEYIYTVTHNNYDYEYTENYSHQNNDWFSMLNLSVGVQHQVGKRWFVQGEPFLKAPMKGVGEGKVNLVSTGVFVSAKYLINR